MFCSFTETKHKNMTTKFYPNKLILILVITHLIVYLSWSYISLSLSEPIVITFSTRDSRALYLFFLVVTTLMGVPYYAPFEEDKKAN